jgi:hypothetical protein
MRGLHGTSTAAVVVSALLAAGGGYALASSTGGKTITVCVKHKGGALYKAKKCAKHDKKLTWNKQGPQGIQGQSGQTGQTGPQGPGAVDIVHDATGTSSATPVTIGTIGPWTLGFSCTQTGSTTAANAYFTGPAGSVDGIDAGSSAGSESMAFPQLTNATLNEADSSSTTTASHTFDGMFEPATGSAVELRETIAAAGGTTNACHFAATVIPVSAQSGATATRHSSTALSRLPSSGPLIP